MIMPFCTTRDTGYTIHTWLPYAVLHITRSSALVYSCYWRATTADEETKQETKMGQCGSCSEHRAKRKRCTEPTETVYSCSLIAWVVERLTLTWTRIATYHRHRDSIGEGYLSRRRPSGCHIMCSQGNSRTTCAVNKHHHCELPQTMQ